MCHSRFRILSFSVSFLLSFCLSLQMSVHAQWSVYSTFASITKFYAPFFPLLFIRSTFIVTMPIQLCGTMRAFRVLEFADGNMLCVCVCVHVKLSTSHNMAHGKFANTIKWKSIFYYVYVIFLIEFPVRTIKPAIFIRKSSHICHAQHHNKPTYFAHTPINTSMKRCISVRLEQAIHSFSLISVGWRRRKKPFPSFNLFIQPKCDNDVFPISPT